MKLAKAIKYAIGAAVTSIAIAGAMPAQAASFVSTFRPPGSSTDVGTIDTTTGTFSPFSNSSLQLTDIALSSTNELYGVTYDQLYKLNPGNNSQQILGHLVVNNVGITGMNGLAFDNNNNLYGIGTGGFYKVDSWNGFNANLTLISNLSGYAPTAFTSGGDTSDLVFDPTNNRFLAVSGNANSLLFAIDLSGNVTTIGNTGFQNVSGLAVEGGTLFGYTTGSPTARQQIKIDPLTGLGSDPTLVVGTNALIGGAASLSSEVISTNQVPEPSFVPGLLVVGGMLGGRYWLKRKHQQGIE